MCRFIPAAVIVLAAVAVGQSPVAFTDATSNAGITWQHNDIGNFMGAGGAFMDYDGDGWSDILLVGGTGDPALYRNLGNGTFNEVTQGAGLLGLPVAPGTVMGATCGDYDGDGDPDLYLSVNGPNLLLRNDGGSFVDVTAQAGVGDPQWSTGAAFGDYDGDGDMDLYVGDYVAVPNFPFHQPFPNVLYRNEGNGTFTDVTSITGVAGAGCTLAVSWSDYDDDGDPDLMVGNDFGAYVQPNRLYRNDGPAAGGGWSFTDVSAASNFDVGIFCMGITAGDYDHDQDLDYYFSNLGRNVLLRNDGAAGFTDVTDQLGAAWTFDPTSPMEFATSWSVGFHDFDQDGWVDLYVSNGHVPAVPSLANGTGTPNGLLRWDPVAGTFQDLWQQAGVGDPQFGRGSSFADYDRDGDIDVLQFNTDGAPVLYRNDSPQQGNYLRVRPIGRASNPDGCGTRVEVEALGVTLIREANPNYGFEASSEPAVHFGLNALTEVERLSLRWPSGRTHSLHHVPAGLELPAMEPVLTVHPSSSAPASVSGGNTWTAQVVVENHHSTQAVSGGTMLEVRILGQRAVFPVQPLTIPAGSTATVNIAIPVPLGLPGLPANAEVLLTVFDSGGGVDQWRAEVSVLP